MRVVLNCRTCGKRLERYPADMRKSRTKTGFCGSECWYSHNQRDNHYLWTGGQDSRMNPEGVMWRRAVLRRDKHHCRLCFAARKLEAHHILPFGTHPAERWKVSNGLTLCHDCHVNLQHREMEHAELLAFIAATPLVIWRG